jgi:hypothetical protein
MKQQDLTLSFSVPKSPRQVFSAINEVVQWWSGQIEGATEKEGDAFVYHYPKMHTSTQRVTQLVDGKRVVWSVEKADLSYLEKPNEWEGTEIVFELLEQDGATEVTLTHRGLTPSCECFSSCTNGWGAFFGENLKNYIMTGKTQADPFARQS